MVTFQNQVECNVEHVETVMNSLTFYKRKKKCLKCTVFSQLFLGGFYWYCMYYMPSILPIKVEYMTKNLSYFTL